MSINNIADITNVVYINLESRPDRKAHIESQLKSVGINNYKRFNAIKTANGAIGCTMSHLKCLEDAYSKGLTHLLVCEDDMMFLKPDVFIKQFNSFLTKHRSSTWDVVLLAGNNSNPFLEIDDTCIRVTRCQTTTAYLVNGAYIPTLIKNIKEGLIKLMHNQDSRGLYAIDRYWMKLQQLGHWFLIIPLTVVQKEGYSDIEKKNVNYPKAMNLTDKKNIVHNVNGESKFDMKHIMKYK